MYNDKYNDKCNNNKNQFDLSLSNVKSVGRLKSHHMS